MAVSVETAGNYDVTFVWNPESKELYATTEVANPAAISTVKTNAVVSVIYNLQGQRVQNNYRGIVVKNGRKVMVK
jgi:pantothenate synthetase